MKKKHYKKKIIFSYFLKSFLQEIRALISENKSQSQEILIEKLSCLIREWWYFFYFCPFSNCFVPDPFLPLILPFASSSLPLKWDSYCSGFFFSYFFRYEVRLNQFGCFCKTTFLRLFFSFLLDPSHDEGAKSLDNLCFLSYPLSLKGMKKTGGSKAQKRELLSDLKKSLLYKKKTSAFLKKNITFKKRGVFFRTCCTPLVAVPLQSKGKQDDAKTTFFLKPLFLRPPIFRRLFLKRVRSSFNKKVIIKVHNELKKKTGRAVLTEGIAGSFRYELTPPILRGKFSHHSLWSTKKSYRITGSKNLDYTRGIAFPAFPIRVSPFLATCEAKPKGEGCLAFATQLSLKGIKEEGKASSKRNPFFFRKFKPSQILYMRFSALFFFSFLPVNLFLFALPNYFLSKLSKKKILTLSKKRYLTLFEIEKSMPRLLSLIVSSSSYELSFDRLKKDMNKVFARPTINNYLVSSKEEKEAVSVLRRSNFFIKEESRGNTNIKKLQNIFLEFLNEKVLRISGNSDSIILKLLWKWAYKRHSKKSNKWLIKQYFPKINGQNRVFASTELITLTKNKKKFLTGLASITAFPPLRRKKKEKGKEQQEKITSTFGTLFKTLYFLPLSRKKQVRKGVREIKKKPYSVLPFYFSLCSCFPLQSKGTATPSLLRKGVTKKEKAEPQVVLTTCFPLQSKGTARRKEKKKTSFQYLINPKPLLLTNTPMKTTMSKVHNELLPPTYLFGVRDSKSSLQFNLFFSVPTFQEISITQDKKKIKKNSPRKICDQINDSLYWSYRKPKLFF